MPDYSKAKIYAIISPSLFKCYIGSTCQRLSQRIKHHRNVLKIDNVRHCTSELIINQPDHRYFIMENYPCANASELRKREGEIIKSMGDMCVNRCVSGRTLKEVRKATYEKHRESRLARMGEPYTCQCGSTIRKGEKSRHERSIKHTTYINSTSN